MICEAPKTADLESSTHPHRLLASIDHATPDATEVVMFVPAFFVSGAPHNKWKVRMPRRACDTLRCGTERAQMCRTLRSMKRLELSSPSASNRPHQFFYLVQLYAAKHGLASEVLGTRRHYDRWRAREAWRNWNCV